MCTRTLTLIEHHLLTNSFLIMRTGPGNPWQVDLVKHLRVEVVLTLFFDFLAVGKSGRTKRTTPKLGSYPARGPCHLWSFRRSNPLLVVTIYPPNATHSLGWGRASVTAKVQSTGIVFCACSMGSYASSKIVVSVVSYQMRARNTFSRQCLH